MDSGNSGSLQSSSDGDEEYDSRAADSVSAFIGGGSIPDHAPAFGDPLSPYLQLHHDPNSSLLNQNLSWPRISAPSIRSDPNQIGHHSMLPTSTPFMPCFQPGIGADGSGCGGAALAPPPNQNQAAARNPKKRSRASRRAPTTVLTTDTSNFRAMVQEFTGIPSPPFNSSAFPRSRLDLFSSRSTSFDAAQPPPYLRRPSAQKIHPPHPFLSSTSSAALDATTNNTTTEAAAASSSTLSMNYQLPITQSSNLFNIPNQNIITSLLQSNPKFQFPTSKPQNSFEIPSNDHQIKIGGLDDQFVLRQISETLTAPPNITATDQVSQRNGREATDSSNADQVNLNLLNGRYDFQSNPMSDQMSLSASSTSEFRGGKAPESIAAAFGVRGEGTVESWICSSE